jgi:hypothetical protein
VTAAPEWPRADSAMRHALHFAAPIVETVAGVALLWTAIDAVIQGRRWLRSQRAVDLQHALEERSRDLASGGAASPPAEPKSAGGLSVVGGTRCVSWRKSLCNRGDECYDKSMNTNTVTEIRFTAKRALVWNNENHRWVGIARDKAVAMIALGEAVELKKGQWI